MRTPDHFILYGTTACHLCEQAAEVLADTGPLRLELVEIDISDNDVLIERYGTRIPVLHHVQSGEELDWPFDLKTLHAFLHNIS